MALWVCLFKPKCDLLPFSGNPGMDLARVHHTGQYLIKIWLKNWGTGLSLTILSMYLKFLFFSRLNNFSIIHTGVRASTHTHTHTHPYFVYPFIG